MHILTRGLTRCQKYHWSGEKWRKLLAEMVEDEQVAMEIARLEEEFRRLTEENRTLVTVHNERAQQLERLCVTTRTRQDSS